MLLRNFNPFRCICLDAVMDPTGPKGNFHLADRGPPQESMYVLYCDFSVLGPTTSKIKMNLARKMAEV